MNHTVRKLIALFMLLWLPLFSASAVAESLAMQLQRGDCQESSEMMVAMSHDDMTDHGMMHHDTDMQMANDSTSNCTDCGICHIACSAFIPAIAALPQLPESGSQAVASYPETFASHLSVPLLPPPLARV